MSRVAIAFKVTDKSIHRLLENLKNSSIKTTELLHKW